jgi:hypothetical protein
MDMNIRIPLALLAAGLLAGGCSTIENNHRQKIPLMAAWTAGDSVTAQQIAGDKVKSRAGTGDELVWRLEAGTLAFTFGKYAESLDEFSASERLISEYDERATVSARDVGSEAGGALSNLNALPYRGWCRDRMGLEIYKSLAYLGQGREDSFRAQVKRLRDRQKEIQEDYAKYFEQEKAEVDKAKKANPGAAAKAESDGSEASLVAKNPNYAQSLAEMRAVAHKGYGNFLNPLALYLSALGNIRDGNWDNAAIDTKRLHEALPANPFVGTLHATTLRNAGREVPASLASTSSFPYPMDRDCLYVIFANGQGANFLQQDIKWPIMVAWPVCEFHPSAYSGAQIVAGGQTVTTAPLADMDAILAEEFDQRLPGIITRTIISTLIKEGAYRGGQVAAIAANNDWRVQAITFVAVTVVGTAYRYAMNTADTRSWETLPKEFQIAQIPMPADRKVHVNLTGAFGGPSFDVAVPASCRSAVLYVSAPSPNNVRGVVLPFESK